jgi:hypothetical protein
VSESPIHNEGSAGGNKAGGKRNIDTGGGTYVEGSVNVTGDYVAAKIVNQAAPLIGVAALHQLPAPPSDFVGRKSELRELSRAVRSRDLAISGLRGMGGVGKTALALKLAEQLKPHYRDAQFFIRLEGLSDAPVDPLEALGHVIRAYAPTAQLPESLDDRRAQYLALLEGKRALLVLDDARDPAQVLPLVPPVGCLLLVTSRQYFTLPGWQARDIGLLSAAEARRLLRQIAPRITRWAGEIARLCGYHPLALRAAGGLLAATLDLEPD